MAADKLLGQLEKVRKTGPDRWMARCPAHADRNASLSVREKGDGGVLVHCFAGCTVHEVVAAAGVELADLFPERPADHCQAPARQRVSAADALRAVGMEALVVCAAASAMATGEPLSAVDRDRLLVAAERVQNALSEAGLWPR
jgi:hypothetical protein